MYNNDMSGRIAWRALYISVSPMEILLSTSSRFITLCTLDEYSRNIELSVRYGISCKPAPAP